MDSTIEIYGLKKPHCRKEAFMLQTFLVTRKRRSKMASATRGKWRGVSNAALGAIVAHPLRCRLLAILADRVASPNEIARELGMPVGDVSYHVRTLREAGAIELVEERPVRGSTEHFYRATSARGPLLTDDDYEHMTADERGDFARHAFQLAAADASVSLESRKFGERHDHHITRVPFAIDEKGWRELGELFRDTLARVLEIQSDSDARMAETGEHPIRGTAFSTFFETP
jgi:DNA-binding transcriptional ArsR family regulator